MKEQEALEKAYGLKTPDDSLELYGEWANDYETHMVDGLGYDYHHQASEIFCKLFEPTNQPILDVGTGTGLLGGAVAKNISGVSIDGVDISQEMLDQADKKKVYRKLFTADLTKSLDIADDSYGAIMSIGTFTVGHVGPSAIDELLRIAKSQALFCIGVNVLAFESAGFKRYFDDLGNSGKTTEIAYKQVYYYKSGMDHDHSGDSGMVAIFHKL